MYFEEDWQSMVEKEPPVGRADNVQTGPGAPSSQNSYCPRRGGDSTKSRPKFWLENSPDGVRVKNGFGKLC